MFGTHLIERGCLSEVEVLRALEQQGNSHLLFGRLAFEKGYMDLGQVVEVLEAQRGNSLRFGALAVELGYLDEAQRKALLELQERAVPRLRQVLVEMGLISPDVAAEELQIRTALILPARAVRHRRLGSAGRDPRGSPASVRDLTGDDRPADCGDPAIAKVIQEPAWTCTAVADLVRRVRRAALSPSR